jgi:osmotically-inducible protein OsmY
VKSAPAALAALLVLTACSNAHDASGAGEGTGKPVAQFSLPPASSFKDALLVAAVKAQLAADDFDSATHVHVTVSDGVARLTGSARSAAQRTKDVSLAEHVKGISKVDDELGVATTNDSKSAGDLAVAAQVTGALAAQTGINAFSVKVSALNGVVTLTGHAPSEAIKSTMLAAAKSVSSVRSVVDKIAVRS